jgi:diguanylate cyclase (GGDEF)-like protein
MVYLGYSSNKTFLDLTYLEIIPPVLTVYTALSDIALLLSLTALILLIVKNAFAPTHLNLAMLMTLLSTEAAVNFADKGELFSLFMLFGAAMLIIALLSESYYLAHYDELTAIPARRALLAHFGTLGRKYTVAMVDIDHFKQFNDTHGHDVGDDVLKLVASRLIDVTGGGSAYRYGGEEFTIVFSGKSTEEARPHLEKVREAVEKSSHTLHVKNRKNPKILSVTISIGAAEKKPEDKGPSDVLKRADNALYKAKKAGRNRVTLG